jgi:hypothetical protein
MQYQLCEMISCSYEGTEMAVFEKQVLRMIQYSIFLKAAVVEASAAGEQVIL